MENQINQNENIATEEDLGEQMRVRREKLAQLKDSGANPYEKTKWIRSCDSDDIKNDFPSFDGKEVSVAGRIISRRIMGKASFAHILDEKGELQIYVKIDNIGAESYEAWKKTTDIGDIIGVKGTVFMTHKGEISVSVTELVLLSK